MQIKKQKKNYIVLPISNAHLRIIWEEYSYFLVDLAAQNFVYKQRALIDFSKIMD
jgi:hypothetical protein